MFKFSDLTAISVDWAGEWMLAERDFELIISTKDLLSKPKKSKKEETEIAALLKPRVAEDIELNEAEYVNFGIKGSTVKQFLSAHNVPTKWSDRQRKMKTKDIYQIASKQTVMVVCHR